MPDKRLLYLFRGVSWLLLLGALAWTVRFLLAGYGNPMDPFYWLYKYRVMEGGWMACGTILAGGAWVRLFGAELLPLRVLGWLCVVIAIALPYCCLLSREERRANIHWLAVAYALMNYGAFQEFSPGALTVPLLSLLWVMMVRYGRKPSVGLAVAIGLVAGVTVTVRFPNILVVPVLLAAMSWRNGQWLPLREWRDRGLMLIGGIVAAAVIYGIAAACITPAYADASMGSHQFNAMLTKLWEKGAMMVAMTAFWGGVALAAMWAERTLPERWKNIGMVLSGLLAGALVSYFITFVPSTRQWYNYDVTYMVSAFCLLLALITRKPALLWGVPCLMVAMLGTDTAWLKLFPIVLCLLPVAAVQYTAEWRRFLWPMAMFLAVTVMIRFGINSIGMADLHIADTRASVSPYKGIYVTAKENEWMEQVVADYDSIHAAYDMPILAVGLQMHRMRALTGCEAAKYNEFWSNIFDKVYAAKYREIIQAEHPIVFCSYSPGFKTKPTYHDKHSALEEMLREEGYTELDRSSYKYMIYIPQP